MPFSFKTILTTAIFNSLYLLTTLSVCASSQAKAQSSIINPMDDSACDDDNQCVIFEVSIHMSSTISTPVEHTSEGSISLPGSFSGSYGSKVTRSGDQCVKQVRVPRDVFMAIVSIMRSLSGDGNLPPAFTPAQQSMLLFYTTLMQQTLQFQCSTHDLQS